MICGWAATARFRIRFGVMLKKFLAIPVLAVQTLSAVAHTQPPAVQTLPTAAQLPPVETQVWHPTVQILPAIQAELPLLPQVKVVLPIRKPVWSPEQRAFFAKVKRPVKRPGTGPDILILGDSQISFGAGKIYNEFFSGIPNHCASYIPAGRGIPALHNANTAALGVRSTGLHSWVARDEQTKATICEVDQKYGVNAGAYGVGGNPERAFVQIGKGPHYQFCTPGRSPFEELFANGYYTPDLLVLAFLGNASKRWADNPDLARRDVLQTLNQIPAGIPCMFMTTVPVHGAEVNARRTRAQTNIKAAFDLYGRCDFVEGYTPEVVAEIEGNAKYFRRRDDGSVKDPFHPGPAAVRHFVTLNTPQICRAVFNQLGQ